jgi:hypothetical protein
VAAGEPLAVQLAPLVADMESVAAGQQQLRRLDLDFGPEGGYTTLMCGRSFRDSSERSRCMICAFAKFVGRRASGRCTSEGGSVKHLRHYGSSSCLDAQVPAFSQEFKFTGELFQSLKVDWTWNCS